RVTLSPGHRSTPWRSDEPRLDPAPRPRPDPLGVRQRPTRRSARRPTRAAARPHQERFTYSRAGFATAPIPSPELAAVVKERRPAPSPLLHERLDPRRGAAVGVA